MNTLPFTRSRCVGCNATFMHRATPYGLAGFSSLDSEKVHIAARPRMADKGLRLFSRSVLMLAHRDCDARSCYEGVDTDYH